MRKKPKVFILIAIVIAVIIILLAGGGNAPTGVIIELDNEETVKEEHVLETSEEGSNQTKEELIGSNVDIKPTNKDSLLGIWVSEGGNIYTIDTESKYSIYTADSESFENGTYVTDEESYITFTSDDETNIKYSIRLLEEENKYGDKFITLCMKKDKSEIKLVKQYEITETIKEQEQQQEVAAITEE